MKNIASILEYAINDSDANDGINTDSTYTNRGLQNQRSLPDLFTKQEIHPSTVIRWDLQLIRYIYNLYSRNAYPQAIDIKRLLIDEHLNIVGSSIKVNSWILHTKSELAIINTINEVHESLFNYILQLKLSNEQLYSVYITYTLSNHYYSMSIKINKKYTVHYYLRSIEHFHNMVEYGLIDDIKEVMLITNKCF